MEIAKMLAHQGKHVVLVARDEAKLNSVKQEIDAKSGEGHTTVWCCNVADGAAMNDMVVGVHKQLGRLDILVNNAGITRDNLLLKMSDEEFDEVIVTNLRSAFVACRAALKPMMRARWGRIINISSVAGLVGNPGQGNYAAAKAGLIGLTKTIAKEMASKSITANVVAPGFIQTDMTDALPMTVKEFVVKATPLQRFGLPQEIAAAVAYLASDEAGFTTGQVLTVDGGMTMY
jgi:3-oxoacyl-[acyl-carrier protein] reductase